MVIQMLVMPMVELKLRVVRILFAGRDIAFYQIDPLPALRLRQEEKTIGVCELFASDSMDVRAFGHLKVTGLVL